VPHLGVVELSGHRQFVMADVPGLVEGASRGRGLGIRFLKHLERTSVLLHLVNVSTDGSSDPVEDWRALRQELHAHGKALAQRPEVVALNKIDLPDVRSRVSQVEADFARAGVEVFAISAATSEGVRDMLEAVWSARPSRADDSAG
jgi:GTP-binding protein